MTSQSITSTPPPQIQQQKHILILGAGISALQTALTLLTSPSTKHHKVTLVAQHTPGDQSPAYTSPWAGGHWRSHATSDDGDERLRRWDARTYEAWCELLESGDGEVEGESMGERERRMGIGFRPSVNFWGRECEETVEGGRGLWWREGVVGGFEVLPLSRFPVRKGDGGGGSELVFGVGYKTICFDPSTYLLYLFNRIQSLGATVIKSPLDNKNGLKGIITAAKSLLKEKEIQDLDIFINCAGLSARHFLPAEETQNLFPIRGQTILVKGEAVKAHTITNLRDVSTEEVLYVIPRPGSGTTILGGCKQAGNFDEGVDEALNGRILERVREWGVAEELRGVDGGLRC